MSIVLRIVLVLIKRILVVCVRQILVGFSGNWGVLYVQGAVKRSY